jgi:tRNA dimethylallyltransferase
MRDMPTVDLAIVGPTASGKTALAVELARSHEGVELVSVDAMAVYRYLDIGTAKPDAKEREGLTWHLIDLVDPTENFSVADFQRAHTTARASITARSHRAIYVGGTGLYSRAVVDGLDFGGRFPEIAADLTARWEEPGGPELLYRDLVVLDPLAASRIDAANGRRVLRALEVTLGSGRPFSAFGGGMTAYESAPMCLVGLRLPREVLYHRIVERLDRQIAAGFIDEVASLNVTLSRTAAQALGYREFAAYLRGEMSLAAAREQVITRTRRFARRQESWFRRDPRINWVDALGGDLVGQVEQLWTTHSTIAH